MHKFQNEPITISSYTNVLAIELQMYSMKGGQVGHFANIAGSI